MVVPISERVPAPRDAAMERARAYMALQPGTPVEDLSIDRSLHWVVNMCGKILQDRVCEEVSMEKSDLPCCGLVEARRVRELPHVYGFDFDLFQCVKCGRYWVYAWLTVGGWEETRKEDAAKMKELEGDELRAFMKEWARSFN